ncbi:MAG: PmoA family protein [Puniceicoccales bacterium]|nr:PmoA family protein [Puniceicoccales bacterium]
MRSPSLPSLPTRSTTIRPPAFPSAATFLAAALLAGAGALLADSLLPAPIVPSACAGEIAAKFVAPAVPHGAGVGQPATIGQWLITEDGKPVLQYNYAIVPKPDEWKKAAAAKTGRGAYLRKYGVDRSNYIHPLWSPAGEIVTADWNHDHGHHRGIYWAWPEVAFAAFPKKLQDLHALQGVFARPTGNLATTKNADGSLTLAAENIWFWSDTIPIVRETAKITVFPLETAAADTAAPATGGANPVPAGTGNTRRVALDFEFAALADGVTIARRGTKGYGGFNVRMAKLPAWRALSHRAKNPAGAPQEKSPAWTGATWRQPSGAAGEFLAFEKTANPCYPGDFVTFKELNWFQPTFPAAGTRYPLKKGEPLKLSFLLWLHDGATTDAVKTAAWRAWQDAPVP